MPSVISVVKSVRYLRLAEQARGIVVEQFLFLARRQIISLENFRRGVLASFAEVKKLLEHAVVGFGGDKNSPRLRVIADALPRQVGGVGHAQPHRMAAAVER